MYVASSPSSSSSMLACYTHQHHQQKPACYTHAQKAEHPPTFLPLPLLPYLCVATPSPTFYIHVHQPLSSPAPLAGGGGFTCVPLPLQVPRQLYLSLTAAAAAPLQLFPPSLLSTTLARPEVFPRCSSSHNSLSIHTFILLLTI